MHDDRNDDDEDLVIDFRGVKSDDTFSDPYTLTHRVEPLELVPEEEPSSKYQSTTSGLVDRVASDTRSGGPVKVEDQETKPLVEPMPTMVKALSTPNKDTPIKPALIKESSPKPTLAKDTPIKPALIRESRESSPKPAMAKESSTEPVLAKEASTNPTHTKATPIKGIVKADLDMDALFKQAKSIMKKKKKGKKKRTKTTSNKDSYSYYAESVCGITLTSQS